MLAKYGYIERAEGTGKERPWRLVEDVQILAGDPDDPSSVRASGELALAILDYETSQFRSALQQAAASPPEWAEAISVAASSTYVTQEEFLDLKSELEALLTRYSQRLRDPATRPPGARPVRLFFAASAVREGPPAT